MFGSKLTAGLDQDLKRVKESCEMYADSLGHKIIVDELGNVWLNKGTTCQKVRGWYTLEQQLHQEYILNAFKIIRGL
ncbi:hypothetical protein CPT_Stills100 [Bacillus phage Stills]|uniref:Uncharacterized protein n=1 Tax=Bacillus phage Stills TaxID=1610833 RepID=A0A0E3XBA5_9CAUD|nr:hypothetical protein CPT_Stills100 [Bacillus phage Stills]AKC02728.1 hypothetical protein CPT_Stills100 [Bacillus phage Stills]